MYFGIKNYLKSNRYHTAKHTQIIFCIGQHLTTSVVKSSLLPPPQEDSNNPIHPSIHHRTLEH